MSRRHPEKGPIGPDDNKRLAMLEAGVSTLSIALAANALVKEGEAYDVFAVTVNAIKFAASATEKLAAAEARATGLEQQLGNLAGYASATLGRLAPDLILAPLSADETPFAHIERLTIAAEPAIAELISRPASAEEANDGAIATLQARVTELTAEVGELEHDLADMTNEKNRLANELAAANEGRPQTAPADPVDATPPAPIVRERPEAARDVGPNYATIDGDELAGLITDQAHGFELAFSNGEYEILTLEPVPVTVNDLVRAEEGKFMVNGSVYAKLQATDEGEQIDGVGLMLGGEQIRYCKFVEALKLEPGNERRFERVITF